MFKLKAFLTKLVEYFYFNYRSEKLYFTHKIKTRCFVFGHTTSTLKTHDDNMRKTDHNNKKRKDIYIRKRHIERKEKKRHIAGNLRFNAQ